MWTATVRAHSLSGAVLVEVLRGVELKTCCFQTRRTRSILGWMASEQTVDVLLVIDKTLTGRLRSGSFS